MPTESPIFVVDSAQQRSRFRPEIFAGTLTKLGIPCDHANEAAEVLFDAAHRARIDEFCSQDLLRIATDLAVQGTTKLAISHALDTVLPGPRAEPQSSSTVVAGPTPSRWGPFGAPRLVLDRVVDVVEDSDPLLAAFMTLTAEIAEPFVHAAARKAVPDVVAAIKQSEFLSGASLERAIAAIEGGLIQTPLSPQVESIWARRLGELVERETLPRDGDEAEWSRAVAKAFVSGANLEEVEDPRREEAEEVIYKKVGSVERRSVRVQWPLYCYETKERRDELDSLDITYFGSSREALSTIDNAVATDKTQVAGGWKADLQADLPDGYHYDVPPTMDMAVYTWQLVERDEGPAIFGPVLSFINDKLKEKKDELSSAAGDAFADALGGVLGSAGIPPIGLSAGKSIARAIGEGFVGWVIKLLIEFTEDAALFPQVTVGHLTLSDGKVSPVSVVALAQVPTGTQTATLVPLGEKTSRGVQTIYADDIYNKKHDRWIRWWRGESKTPGRLDYELVKKIHETKVGALVWRPAANGFGVVVKQTNSVDDDGKYAVALRADVRKFVVV